MSRWPRSTPGNEGRRERLSSEQPAHSGYTLGAMEPEEQIAVEPQDRHAPPTTRKRGSYSYQRIADRHSRPPSSLSLKTVFLWLIMAIAVAAAFDRYRPRGDTPRPEPVATTPLGAEAGVNAPSDEPPRILPVSRTQPAAAAESPQPPARVQPDEEAMGQADKPAKPDTSVKVTFNRDRGGNYVGLGMINQKNVKLLADTGASIVVVPERIAKQIGLKSGRPMQFRTAGGLITHYATTLDSLSIGPIQIRDVEAVINPSMQEDFALLGMNVLALLHMTQQDGSLILSYDRPLEQDGRSGLRENAAEPAARFKRSVKECLGSGKIIDQKTLNCLNGG